MPWAFIVIGLFASVFGAWSAGEEFRVVVERSPASDPNDPPNITHSLALVMHDGSQYRVRVDDPSEAEVGAGRGRQ